MRRVAILPAGLGMILCCRAALADINMQPGLWETRTDESGTILEECYLSQDVANTDKFQRGLLPYPGGSCVATNFQQNGATRSYTLTCTINGEHLTKQITATYAGDHGTAAVATAGGTAHYTRKRIGNCDKSSFGQ